MTVVLHSFFVFPLVSGEKAHERQEQAKRREEE